MGNIFFARLELKLKSDRESRERRGPPGSQKIATTTLDSKRYHGSWPWLLEMTISQHWTGLGVLSLDMDDVIIPAVQLN